MKICHVCHESKPHTEYYVHKNAPDGRGYVCKDCSRAHSVKWNREHKDQFNATNRRYWAKHADKKNAARKSALQTEAGRTKRAAQRRKWYANETNKKKSLEASQAWRESDVGQAWQAEYMARTKDRRRAMHVLRRYGLEPKQYQALIDQQKGVCAICKEPPEKQWAVDHDHKTDVVRGLLCPACNRGLGDFKDDPKRLRGAIRYLKTLPNS